MGATPTCPSKAHPSRSGRRPPAAGVAYPRRMEHGPQHPYIQPTWDIGDLVNGTKSVGRLVEQTNNMAIE